MDGWMDGGRGVRGSRACVNTKKSTYLLLNYLFTYLPNYLPTCLSTYLPTYLLTYLDTYLALSFSRPWPSSFGRSHTHVSSLARSFLLALPRERSPFSFSICLIVCLFDYLFVVVSVIIDDLMI